VRGLAAGAGYGWDGLDGRIDLGNLKQNVTVEARTDERAGLKLAGVTMT
jgi:hypothetical protein